MSEQTSSSASVRLSQATLGDLPDDILRPVYDRGALTAGIVHIGVGNFHRAHQAWYLHRLMQFGRAMDWAIIGAGVRAGDAEMRERLLAQDCLTTLIELGPRDTALEVIGPMIDFVPVADDNAPLIRAMAAPSIRIVSLTVTEGGYFIDASTGSFDAAHPDIVHDAAFPDTPRTAFGAMIAALRQRRAAGHRAFTMQSCDNLQGNGDILRRTVVGLARMSDPELASWIDREAAFPNSMVDCIVPATGPAEKAKSRAHGIDDNAPVTHENFRQWVIEDQFCAGRPEWERVGATMTHEVHAYEAMKIRMLNAGHQVLANAGELLSIPTISDCMHDPQIAAFFRKVQADEILPNVAPVPEMSPPEYLDLIEQRFANPAIRDTTRRVAFDGSSRHTGFVLPIIENALVSGGSVSGLALVEALWARMCTGVREDGSEIEPNDPFWSQLQETATAAESDPSIWLGQTHLYGDAIRVPEFTGAFTGWLKRIHQTGCRETLRHYLNGP